MNIKKIDISLKNIILAIGLIPAFVGAIEIFEKVKKYISEPSFNISRISINDHYLTYETKNLIGGSKRNQFNENKQYKKPSAQISITVTNPTENSLSLKGFSLYVETFKSKKGYSFPTYFILNDKTNPSQQFNTSIFIPSKSSLDIEFDVLVMKNRKKIFAECASRFSISFFDQNFNTYSLEKSFNEPTCRISQKVISKHKLSLPIPENIHIYGQENGYNPFLNKQ